VRVEEKESVKAYASESEEKEREQKRMEVREGNEYRRDARKTE
jgi:hypothetical protein